MTDQANNTGKEDPKWQQDVLTKLLFASLEEQKRTRLYSNIFKGIFAGYLIILLLIMLLPSAAKDAIPKGDHTALIEINGVIAAKAEASADNIVTGLRKAFKNEDAKGIILRINSPGGSPVQSGYINDEIQRLKKLHPDKKVYAVITDLCASGGYYIAAAADEIYADKASVVGSIGVVMNGFGFVDAMEKLGVERRLYTAGENKGFLDPFSPQKQAEIDHIETLLLQIHQQFIDVVKTGRGDKIKDDKKLFSGLVWTGEEAIKLGLVDAIGSSSHVARDIIKAEEIVDYTPKPSYFEQLADRLGIAAASTLAESFQNNNILMR
jgi:protease-4